MGRSLALLADVAGLGPDAPSDGQFLQWNATRRLWVPTTQPLVTMAYLSGDVSNAANPAAWADVTGLSFTLASGGTYTFEFFLNVTTAATTTRASLGVNGPTNSLLIVNTQQANTTNSPSGNLQYTNTAYDTAGTVPASSSGATPVPAAVNGIIRATAAGTLILRQKSNVNASAVTCKAGSWGRLTRVA